MSTKSTFSSLTQRSRGVLGAITTSKAKRFRPLPTCSQTFSSMTRIHLHSDAMTDRRRKRIMSLLSRQNSKLLVANWRNTNLDPRIFRNNEVLFSLHHPNKLLLPPRLHPSTLQPLTCSRGLSMILLILVFHHLLIHPRTTFPSLFRLCPCLLQVCLSNPSNPLPISTQVRP